MTALDIGLPANDRAQLLAKMRERIDEWLRLSYRHEVLVARFVRGLQIEATAVFDRVVTQPMLREIGARLPALRVAANPLRDALPGVMSLRTAIDRIAAEGSQQIRVTTEQHMVTIARQEAQWVERSIASLGASTHPSTEAAASAAHDATKKLWLGDSTEQWFASMLQKPTADRARAWVTTGLQQGLTTDEITRGLVGTKTQSGVLEAPRAAAATLVRTASTHATTAGRTEAFRSLGVKWWRFTATLDHRTSLVCAAHDGLVYAVDDASAPVPPLHPNCRSVQTPVLREGEEPTGKRASIKGQVPASTTFADWVAKLTQAEQDAWFGKTKAAAFRAGKLTLQQMLGRDLQPLTLDELRALDRL